jgi:hypothetical protein
VHQISEPVARQTAASLPAWEPMKVDEGVVSGNQWSSVVISGHQWSSVIAYLPAWEPT